MTKNGAENRAFYTGVCSLKTTNLMLFSMLPINDIEEGLSEAYVKAICSMAGYNTGKSHKDFGFDITVKDIIQRASGRTVESGFNLDIQIKATKNFRQNHASIIYDLKNKTYNDLTDNSSPTPRILVVLCLPQNQDEWIGQDIDSLILKKCAYWHYLGGQTPVDDNESTTAVYIPKSNPFTVENLNKLMDSIKTGVDISGL